MRILVLGGDGYLGWPAAMYLSARSHDVAVLDNFSKREWEQEFNGEPLFPISTFQDRVRVWEEVTGLRLSPFIGDLCEYDFVRSVVRDFRPDVIIHFGEQPSAPFSMTDQRRCVLTLAKSMLTAIRNHDHRIRRVDMLPRIMWDED